MSVYIIQYNIETQSIEIIWDKKFELKGGGGSGKMVYQHGTHRDRTLLSSTESCGISSIPHSNVYEEKLKNQSPAI